MADQLTQESTAPILAPSPFADELEPEATELEGEEPKGEETEGEETEKVDTEESEGDESELSEEELDEILQSLEEDLEGKEEPEKTDTVPHAALHKERERRKELQGNYNNLMGQMNQLTEVNKGYKTQLEDVARQLKELGVDQMVKIDLSEPAPEVVQARLQQQTQNEQAQLTNLIGSLRTEAMSHIDEFPTLDPKDEDTGELLLGYALAATYMGMDPEDAILKGMKILNARSIDTHKKANRKVLKKPAPASSPKRAPRQSSANIKPGETRGFFRGVASNLMEPKK